jgi:CPA1 family monovalent cation:H+ antiporter
LIYTHFDAFMDLGWPALGVFGAIQFLARPLSVQCAALGSTLTMAERHLLAWIAPRGIVAAAISALFAIKLEAIGYPEASRLVPLTFMVIIGTVLLQSATAGPIAKWLKVAEPEPSGFLIIGANPVARAIAEALQENGFRVILTDQSWDHVTAAKLAGLSAYWGNPVSEHAERHIDLTGIGHLMAVSPNVELNALAAHYYRLEFEANHIYAIGNHPPEDGKAEEKTAFRYGGLPLFHEELTYPDLLQQVEQGAEVRTTGLTEAFSYPDYLARHGDRRLPLFAIDDSGNIHVFTPEPPFSPEPGWKILSLSLDRPLSGTAAGQLR